MMTQRSTEPCYKEHLLQFIQLEITEKTKTKTNNNKYPGLMKV